MKKGKRAGLWSVPVLLFALLCVGATGALLRANSGVLTNTLATGRVDTEIVEYLEEGKQVQVKNTGELPVYVRARIVVGGVQADKLVYTATAPEEAVLAASDRVYLLLGDTEAWAQAESGSNNWYYYMSPLGAGESTPLLMSGVLVGGQAAYDADHFTVTVTQESVVAAEEKTTAEQLAAAFEER